MRLGHGLLGAVQAIENQLAEKTETHLAGDVDMALARVVHDVDIVTGLLPRDVDVFAELDVAFGAENDGAAIAPGAEAVRGKPVDADVVRRAIVTEQRRFAEVLELRLVGIREIANGG